MSPVGFRRIALAAWLAQALIVLSGAAVRLTDAGLGCEDWPACNDERLVPAWELHGWIEFGNRLISLLVALTTVAAVIAARRRRPRRPDLVRYSWWLVAGTVAQVALGGVTVLLDLNPIVVSGHFLVSMGLLWTAQTLWLRAGEPDHEPGERRPSRAHPDDRQLAGIQLGLATMVLLTGTVVTGSGPNSGDARADRLGLDLTWVARIHSVTVWLLLAALVALALRLARRPARSAVADRGRGPGPFAVVRWLLVAAIAQGAVGYVQYAAGVPPLLVELHVLGALVVWTLSILLHQRLAGSTVAAAPGRDPADRRDRIAA